MSEVMLHAVLNMPIDIWSDDHLSKIQRHSRYVEASELIRNQDSEIDQLRQKLEAAEQIIREAREHISVLIEIGQLGFSEIQEPEHDEIFNQIKSAENFLLAAPVPAMPIQDNLSKLAENFKFATESKEFERYAIARKMNMDMHPLHYIFLDVEASTARDAWRSAMNYAVKVLAGNQSEVKPSC